MIKQSRNDTLTLIALSTLAESDGPTGARRLAEIFTRNGYETAEATAGRFLHKLDEAGLSSSIGKQGRTLTEAGKLRLNEMRWQAQILSETAKVAEAVDATHRRELFGLLYARRAVESETARLAALQGTDADIAAIIEAAGNCHCVSHQDRNLNAQSFHRAVIHASRNPLLIAVGTLLLNPQIEPAAKMVLSDISQQRGDSAELSGHHAAITQAIAERDSVRAETLMREHIDAMIRVVSG